MQDWLIDWKRKKIINKINNTTVQRSVNIFQDTMTQQFELGCSVFISCSTFDANTWGRTHTRCTITLQEIIIFVFLWCWSPTKEWIEVRTAFVHDNLKCGSMVESPTGGWLGYFVVVGTLQLLWHINILCGTWFRHIDSTLSVALKG